MNKMFFSLVLGTMTALSAPVPHRDAEQFIAKADRWDAGAPRLRGPAVFGATPGRQFVHPIPVCGSRDGLRLEAEPLPEGVLFDGARGVLTGRAAKGEYEIRVRAKNGLGEDARTCRLVVGEGKLALTPMMGWSSWNALTTHVTQRRIIAAAKGLVEKGLAARGYSYVNLDVGWEGERSDFYEGDGALKPNELFPDMKAMTDAVHALGLKAGIYSSPMVFCWGTGPGRHYRGCTDFPLDPAAMEGRPFVGVGKRHFEREDAAQWAAWGFDLLKYDWPRTDLANMNLMRDALDATGRDFVLQLCTDCSVTNAAGYAGRGQFLRGHDDSSDRWDRLSGVLRKGDAWAHVVGPGCWYDFDMFCLGRNTMERPFGEKDLDADGRLSADPKFDNRLTRDETIFAFAYWALFPTPLVLSCDLTSLDGMTLDLLSNDEMIAINQDYPAKMAAFEDRTDGVRVARRVLSDGRIAWGFFNTSDRTSSFTYPLGRVFALRDPLALRDLGAGDALDLSVPPHGVKVAVGRLSY